MCAQEKRPVVADDLYRFRLIADCRIAPDGRHVVYSLSRVDRDKEKTYANLWVVPLDGGKPLQFTYGDQVDGQPRWSPDGSQIAFLSNRRDEEQPQIYLIPFHGGEARPLTDLKGEFASFQWSPDGRRLVCQFRRKDQEAIERQEDERKKELGVVSRYVTRIFYKLDGTGFLPQERWHLWTVDVRSGEASPLTEGQVYDELEPCWSPDGREIAFFSNRSPDPDLDPDAIDLFVVPAEGGELRKIETPVGPKEKPAYSPDGAWLAYVGREGRGQEWRNQGLWVVPADGSGPARNLTEPLDLEVNGWTANDLPGGLPLVAPTWSPGGDELYFQVARHGDTTLRAIALDGDPDSLETVIGDSGVVGCFSFDRDFSRLAYLHGTLVDPGQVWVRDVATDAATRLTAVNEDLFSAFDLGEIEEVWFTGPSGADLQGWIFRPPGFDPAQTYPSILEIHGGPRVQYGHLFMHEFHVLAAQGYVVYCCNPRGSQGYGEAHSKAIVNDWGTADYEDLMAWADLVQHKSYVDDQRMGVTGGSYGGYMTAWIIGHTDRFKAAVIQRCVSNLVSMYGTSDFNWSFETEFGDRPPWENVDNYWRQSPMKTIGNARTPTLVIHSEQDHRCSIEQGEQVFVALKKLGVDTAMVRFPDEPHGLSRGGRTDRRIERLTVILDWFDRYLKDG